MKHAALSLLLCMLLSFQARGQEKPAFHIKFSEPFAVYEFVKKLSAHEPDNAYRQAFEQSVYNTEAYRELVAAFDSLQLDYYYLYQDYPYGQKVPGLTLALLRHNLISAENLKAFIGRSAGIVPNAELLRLAAILAAFQPVYDAVIYKPNQIAFESQLAKLATYASEKHTEQLFEAGLRFYQSSWNNSIPFEIAVLPKPGGRGFSAQAFLNNAVSEIPASFQKYDVLLSVLLHEIYHILYDEQPLQTKRNIEQWFDASTSESSQYAYLLLNEALATALGNGYAYEKLNGNTDPDEWYHRKYINLMAKAIYQTVQAYIENGKAIDEAFVNTYIRLYDENFRNWNSEADHLLAFRYVLAETPADFQFFHQQYPYSSVSEYEYPLSEKGLENMKSKPVTKVIIVSEDHKNKLRAVKKQFPELRNWKFKATKDFAYSHFLGDKTYLIIVNKHSETVEEIFKAGFVNGIIQ